AAIEIANNTYNDPNPSEATIRDAIWMHNNFFDGWVQDYEDRAGESATNQLYYDRLEECLNNAIQTCASAINYYSNDILIEMISSTTVVINEENEIKINLTNENDGLIEKVQPKFVSSSSYDIVEQFILENSSTIVNMTTGQELTWTGKIQFNEVGDINVNLTINYEIDTSAVIQENKFTFTVEYGSLVIPSYNGILIIISLISIGVIIKKSKIKMIN
ncbi:MAG: hypothetical protein GY870_22220, partial [archaeon]|nr:hypothetical protein [archaeon]